MNTSKLIKAFVETAKTFDDSDIYVKSGLLAKELNVSNFSTDGHSHLAMFQDEVGNITVLTEKGRVKQLINDEEILNELNCKLPTTEQVLSEYNDCTLVAVIEGGKRVVEYVMTNLKNGSTHKLDGVFTSTERLEAHWAGFCNDQNILPPIRVVQLEGKVPYLPYFPTYTSLKNKIQKKRNHKELLKVSKEEGMPCIRSRQTEMLFIINGERCGETYLSNPIKKDHITQALIHALKGENRIEEVWLSGGYDGAESLYALNNTEYEPQIHMWDILLWDNKSQFLPTDWILL